MEYFLGICIKTTWLAHFLLSLLLYLSICLPTILWEMFPKCLPLSCLPIFDLIISTTAVRVVVFSISTAHLNVWQCLRVKEDLFLLVLSHQCGQNWMSLCWVRESESFKLKHIWNPLHILWDRLHVPTLPLWNLVITLDCRLLWIPLMEFLWKWMSLTHFRNLRVLIRNMFTSSKEMCVLQMWR